MITSIGDDVKPEYIHFVFPPKIYKLTSREIHRKRTFIKLYDVIKYGWVKDNSSHLDDAKFYFNSGEDKFAWCLHYKFPRFSYTQNQRTGKYEVAFIFGGQYELWYRDNKYYGRARVKSGKFYSKQQFKKVMFFFKSLFKNKKEAVQAFQKNQQGLEIMVSIKNNAVCQSSNR